MLFFHFKHIISLLVHRIIQHRRYHEYVYSYSSYPQFIDTEIILSVSVINIRMIRLSESNLSDHQSVWRCQIRLYQVWNILINRCHCLIWQVTSQLSGDSQDLTGAINFPNRDNLKRSLKLHSRWTLHLRPHQRLSDGHYVVYGYCWRERKSGD